MLMGKLGVVSCNATLAELGAKGIATVPCPKKEVKLMFQADPKLSVNVTRVALITPLLTVDAATPVKPKAPQIPTGPLAKTQVKL